MSSNRVDGLAETYAMLDAIPAAARHELADMTGKISRDVMAAQKRDVAKDKGKLEAGLSVALETEKLRARIGLIGIKRGRSGLFYGVIVEKGRDPGVVQRRLPRTKGRMGRKAAQAVGATRKMRVTALAERPFVHVDRPEIRAEARLANFWAETLRAAKAGAFG